MIRIAVVEDEELYAEQLQNYISKYAEEQKKQLKVTWFQDGEDIVSGYKGEYDIILLDIQMRFMDGMTAAEKIRELDSEVVLMFITNIYYQYDSICSARVRSGCNGLCGETGRRWG